MLGTWLNCNSLVLFCWLSPLRWWLVFASNQPRLLCFITSRKELQNFPPIWVSGESIPKVILINGAQWNPMKVKDIQQWINWPSGVQSNPVGSTRAPPASMYDIHYVLPWYNSLKRSQKYLYFIKSYKTLVHRIPIIFTDPVLCVLCINHYYISPPVSPSVR